MKRVHQNYKKTFDELNYKEQAQSINMYKLNLKKMEDAHEKRRKELNK